MKSEIQNHAHAAFLGLMFAVFFSLGSEKGLAVPDSRNPKDWYARAEADFKAARLIENERISPANVCFHVHQEFEKYLKGLMIKAGLRPEQSHDLSGFIKSLERKKPELKRFEKAAGELDDLYVPSRYPKTGIPEINEAEAGRCMSYGEDFLKWFSSTYPEGGTEN